MHLPPAATLTALTLISYLIGSIPFGFLIARSRGVDIRAHGSGNIGATNVGRVLGKRVGFLCFGLDVLKGLVPSLAASLLAPHLSGERWFLTAAPLCAAACAVLGHVFPVWLGFRGGKGVATGFGAMLGLWPLVTFAAAGALAVWIVSLMAWRMVSVSSCLAALAMPALVAVSPGVVRALGLAPPGVVEMLWAPSLAVTVLLAAIVIYKHRGNLARVLAGTEPKVGRGKGSREEGSRDQGIEGSRDRGKDRDGEPSSIP